MLAHFDCVNTLEETAAELALLEPDSHLVATDGGGLDKGRCDAGCSDSHGRHAIASGLCLDSGPEPSQWKGGRAT